MIKKLNSISSTNYNSGTSTQNSLNKSEDKNFDLSEPIYYLTELINCYPYKENPIQNSVFYSDKKPKLSFKQYLQRIFEKIELDQSCFIYAFILFEKIIVKNSFKIKELNFHKLYFIALIISIKILEDQRKIFFDQEISMQQLKKVSGIPIKELIQLELEFLQQIKFKLFIDDEKLIRYQQQMQSIQIKLQKNELQNIFDIL